MLLISKLLLRCLYTLFILPFPFHMMQVAMQNVNTGPPQQQIIPRVNLSLHSSECLCDSITDLERSLNAVEAVNQTCTANEECDGVRCAVVVPHGLFYDEFVVLPCARPPAVEYVITDADLHPLDQVIFDESGNNLLDNLGFNVTSFIERGPRSMSIEVCKTAVTFYEFEVHLSTLTNYNSKLNHSV